MGDSKSESVGVRTIERIGVERYDRDLETKTRWSGGVRVFYFVRPDSLNGQATLTSDATDLAGCLPWCSHIQSSVALSASADWTLKSNRVPTCLLLWYVSCA